MSSDSPIFKLRHFSVPEAASLAQELPQYNSVDGARVPKRLIVLESFLNLSERHGFTTDDYLKWSNIGALGFTNTECRTCADLTASAWAPERNRPQP